MPNPKNYSDLCCNFSINLGYFNPTDELPPIHYKNLFYWNKKEIIFVVDSKFISRVRGCPYSEKTLRLLKKKNFKVDYRLEKFLHCYNEFEKVRYNVNLERLENARFGHAQDPII